MAAKQKHPHPRTRPPLPPLTASRKDHARPTSHAQLAKFVLTEILGDNGSDTPPYNPKWRDLEEQSYIVLASLRVLTSYMEERHRKGMNGAAVSDCLSLLDPLIAFLNAVDLTALVMEKARAQREGRGKGKGA